MDIPRAISYVLKDDDKKQEFIGYYADEMMGFCPEAVEIDEDGRPAGIDYSRLVVPLLEMVADLNARLEQLEG